MASSTKQVKRLKKNAQQLWSDQQELLDRANSLAKDAWPHAQKLAKDKVGPGAVGFYEDRVRPTVDKGTKAGKAAGSYVGSTTKDAVQGTVVPAVTSAAAAALAIANEAGDRLGLGGSPVGKQTAKAKKSLDKATRSGHRSEAKAHVKLKAAAKAGTVAAKAGSKKVAVATGRKKSGPGAGGVIGILLGVAVLGGIAYAVWQTLRADDDLWVADEDPETSPTSDAPTA